MPFPIDHFRQGATVKTIEAPREQSIIDMLRKQAADPSTEALVILPSDLRILFAAIDGAASNLEGLVKRLHEASERLKTFRGDDSLCREEARAILAIATELEALASSRSVETTTAPNEKHECEECGAMLCNDCSNSRYGWDGITLAASPSIPDAGAPTLEERAWADEAARVLRDFAEGYDHEEQTHEHQPFKYGGGCRTCMAEKVLASRPVSRAAPTREAESEPKCDCWKYERQVCDICQGVTAAEAERAEWRKRIDAMQKASHALGDDYGAWIVEDLVHIGRTATAHAQGIAPLAAAEFIEQIMVILHDPQWLPDRADVGVAMVSRTGCDTPWTEESQSAMEKLASAAWTLSHPTKGHASAVAAATEIVRASSYLARESLAAQLVDVADRLHCLDRPIAPTILPKNAKI